jgi:hypothetical protein
MRRSRPRPRLWSIVEVVLDLCGHGLHFCQRYDTRLYLSGDLHNYAPPYMATGTGEGISSLADANAGLSFCDGRVD